MFLETKLLKIVYKCLFLIYICRTIINFSCFCINYRVKLAVGIRPAQLLLVGKSADYGQTTHLAPAIVYTMEHVTAHILDLTTLFSESTRSPEEACVQVYHSHYYTISFFLFCLGVDLLLVS